MNKKMIKIALILALVVLTVFTLVVPVFATDTNYSEFNISAGNDLGKFDNSKDTSGASNSIGRIASAVLNIVRVVAVAAAVIILIVLAIKYISSAPNDKAEIKKHAVVYVVGAVLLFSASGVLGIIQRFASNIYADK